MLLLHSLEGAARYAGLLLANKIWKMSNVKKSQKISKNHLSFQKSRHFEKHVFVAKKSLRPELSSPAHFRIQGGLPERDGGVVGVVGVVVAGRYFPFLI